LPEKTALARLKRFGVLNKDKILKSLSRTCEGRHYMVVVGVGLCGAVMRGGGCGGKVSFNCWSSRR